MNFKDYADKSRELSAAATPGPWGTSLDNDAFSDRNGDGQWVGETRTGFRDDSEDAANTALIAHNRTAADVWREAFLELVGGSYQGQAEAAFDHAYDKVARPAACRALERI